VLSDWLDWRKSSSCTQGDCVEVAWRKSSSCIQGGCVEVSQPVTDTILVRDSKNPDGAFLTFTADEWRAFLDGARAGEFDA
jgi:hypothetical protein